MFHIAHDITDREGESDKAAIMLQICSNLRTGYRPTCNHLAILFHVYEEATCLEDPANTECLRDTHAGMQFLSFEFSEYYCALTVAHPLHSSSHYHPTQPTSQ